MFSSNGQWLEKYALWIQSKENVRLFWSVFGGEGSKENWRDQVTLWQPLPRERNTLILYSSQQSLYLALPDVRVFPVSINQLKAAENRPSCFHCEYYTQKSYFSPHTWSSQSSKTDLFHLFLPINVMKNGCFQHRHSDVSCVVNLSE